MIEAFNSVFLTPRMTLATELRNVATSCRLFLQLRNNLDDNSTLNNDTLHILDGPISGVLNYTFNNNSVSNSTIDPVKDSPNLNNDGTFNAIIQKIDNALEKVRNYDVLATTLTDPHKRINAFSDITYLPVRTVLLKESKTICKIASHMLTSNLTFLKEILEMDKRMPSNRSLLLSDIKTYDFSIKSYLDCLNEYPNVIGSIQENITSKEYTRFDVDKHPVVSLGDFNLDEIYAPLLHHKQLIKDLLDRYVSNSITKEFLALQFSQERVSVAEEGISVFLNTVDARIIQPFRSTISVLQKEMPALYLDLFQMAASLEKYFKAGNFTNNIKQLDIWKRPLVKIDTNVYEVKMTENASGRFKGNNTLEEISQGSMQQKLDEHIRAYFEPSLVIIDDFSAKLRLYERDLTTALREGLTSYSKFLESTKLNGDFVRY